MGNRKPFCEARLKNRNKKQEQPVQHGLSRLLERMAFDYGWTLQYVRDNLTMAQFNLYVDRMAERLKPWKTSEKQGKFKSFNPWRGRQCQSQ